MFGLGRKNNIIIRKKECISNKNWNKPNPDADGIYVVGHEKTETIIVFQI